jgi:hypothetical protein
MKRLLAIAAGVGVAAALAAPVLACGDGWMGENLVATPGVKAALRATFLRAHPEYSSAQVGAPVSGRTYYGSYSNTRYAIATFAVGSGPSYPTIFKTDRHGRWQVRRQTRGAICESYVPLDLLIGHWWLQRYDAHCFVPAR